MLSAVALLYGASDSKNGSVGVAVGEEMLLTQTGANANLKIRLSSGVTAQVWGDSSTACSNAQGSLTETASGTYTISLSTIPFGTNQNNYVCVKSSDSTLNANVVWPHVATSLAFVQQPSNTASGASITPAVTVEVLDATGTLMSGDNTDSIALAITTGTPTSGGPGTLSGTTPKTVVNGIATFSNLSINTAGIGYKLHATSGSLTAADSTTFNITAGAVNAGTSTVSASPTPITADGTTTSTITVTLKDVNSNPVSGKTVTLAQGGGHSSISAASGASSTLGVVTFTVTDTTAETVTYTATDSTDTVTITQTAAVTFTAGALDHFKVEKTGGGAVGTQTAGTSFSLRLTAQDVNNNTVTSFTSAVSLTSTGTLTGSPVTSGAFTAGVLDPQSVTITNTGSFTITATGSAKTGISNSFTVNSSVATKLAIVTPSGCTNASDACTTNPDVTVQDQFGNTVTTNTGNNASIGLTINCTGSMTFGYSQGTPHNAVSGIALFTVNSIDHSRNGCTITTTNTSSLTNISTSSFNVP